MKFSFAAIGLVIGVVAARRKLAENATQSDTTDNNTLSDAPPCSKAAICTNHKWDKTQCEQDDLEFPGFNVATLRGQDNHEVGLNNTPYDIINCGNGYNRSTVERWITDAQAAAIQGLNDSKWGVNSQYGFKAFFKSNESVEPVQEVLELIKDGVVPYTDGCFGGARPAAICINDNSSIPQSLRDACVDQGPVFTSTDYPSALLLCPDLIAHYDLVDYRVKCPTYSKTTGLKDDGSLAKSAEILFTNALAWIYLGVSFDSSSIDDISTAISLDEFDSYYNAPNYAYYSNGTYNVLLFHQVVRLLIHS